MEDEEKFEIVLHAGNAESSAIMAMEAAREGDFDEAERLQEEAEAEYHAAHNLHSKMLAAFAGGTQVEMDLLLAHAQDHLSMATVLKDVSAEMLCLRKELHEVLGRLDALEEKLP